MTRNWQLEMLIFKNDIKNYLTDNVSNPFLSTTSSKEKLILCYDDFYCNNDELAHACHVALGIFGLLLTLTGLVLNVLLIPVMSLVGIRSSATYYMIAMAISDSCLLIINLVLVVIRYLPSNEQVDQLLMYQSFVAYLVPFGFPAKSLCQILSMSFCTGLVLDRFAYLKIEKKSKNYVKCTIAVKALVSIATIIILTKLPNFLLLKIVENHDSFPAFISVRWTMLAKPWIFIFDTTIFISVYMLLIISVILLSYLSLFNQYVPHFTIKKRFEVAPEQRIRRRERLYLGIGLFVGILTLFLKFPHLLRYILNSFDPVHRSESQRYHLVLVEIWMEMMDMMLIVLKPVMYLIFAIHFRQALKDMIGLWLRPSNYNELQVSGGMGKVINLRDSTSSKISRSDTADTLLRLCNSDNKLNEPIIHTQCPNISIIEALAEERVYKPKTLKFPVDSTPSDSFIGSTVSFNSCFNSESQSSNPKT